jgi:MinD-like ATPase involved in chromosome partitioning or flagellar assembly
MKKVLVINSAKGGVGKTETTINIAKELSKRGETVAILDLDITTPNIGKIDGIKTFSAKRNTTLSKKQIKELIIQSVKDFDNGWLLIDTPPTISSLYSAITETIKNSKFLFVTTPSKNAINDTSFGIKFFAQRGVIPIGLIQNMVGGVFGEQFDSISKMGIETIGVVPISNELEEHFSLIVDKLEKIDFQEVFIEEDSLPILSTLTQKEAEEDDNIPLRFYNLETWDIMRERLIKEDITLESLNGIGQSINSHFNISTTKLETIIKKGTHATIMIKDGLSVLNAPLPYEIQDAEIIYDNKVSKGLPMFKLSNGVFLWWHECMLIETKTIIETMNEGGIDIGDGRIIQSLHSQMYYNRIFNRNAIDSEINIIKRHIAETKIIPNIKQIIYSIYLLENDGNDSYENFQLEKYIESQKESFPKHYEYLNTLISLKL